MAEDGDGEFAFDLNEPPLEHGNVDFDYVQHLAVVLSYHFFGIILPGSELTFALLVKHLEHNASGGGSVERERARPSGSLVNSCEDGGQEWQICVPSYLYTALNVGLHWEMLDIILQNW
uniref:Uncharacterized protein n=1 Tax=Oryza glaberrima TaxID=4538 RepID=I1P8A1_ORYGL